MASTILSDNGVISGSAGIKSSADGTGVLALQTTTSGGTATTAVSISTSQVVTLTNALAEASGGTGTTIGYNGFKNRIINGAMVIDQRNAGASSTTPTINVQTYGSVDRFAYVASQASKFTMQQTPSATETGFATRVAAGFSNYLACTVGASANVTVSATDFFAIQQPIEGLNVGDLAWGTANAKTITFSFWVNCSLTGTFGGSLRNAALNRSYPFTYTISAANTWEQKTITIAGDTSGTWLTTNGVGIYLQLNLGYGSTYSNTPNAWVVGNFGGANSCVNWVSTNSATFYITGVQFEKGSTATSFDYRPYTTELQLCQRYFEKSFDIGTAVAQNSGTYNGTSVASSPGQLSGMAFGDTRFKINKRTAATLTFYNPAAANAFARDQNAGVDCTATSAWMAGESSFAISASTGVGSGVTNRIAVHWSASSEL
jgi:hypothetical protein